MTGAELKQWADRSGARDPERQNKNGIDYLFYTLPDGWTAILEDHNGEFTPVTQARDRAHAMSYISLREPVKVPFTII